MKKYITVICSLLILTIASCKKDLEINVDKTFVEEGKTGGDLGFGGIILQLSPDGKAGILYGGDIFYSGTYKIRGSKLIMTEGNKRNEFKVISNTELRYEGNRTLILQNN